MTRRVKLEIYFTLLIIGILLVVIISYGICRLIGKCYARYDATFQKVGICTDATQLQPTKESILSPGQMYFCGEIKGTTPRSGVLYLFRNGKVVYYTTEFWKEPGFFSESLPLQDTSIPGNYQIKVSEARRNLVEFTFEIR